MTADDKISPGMLSWSQRVAAAILALMPVSVNILSSSLIYADEAPKSEREMLASRTSNMYG